MFWRSSTNAKSDVELSEQSEQLHALNQIQAIIQFSPDGTILSANDNFLKTLGYSLDEIQGQHHSMFMDPAMSRSAEYAEFWKMLRSGSQHSGEFARKAKDGSTVWIEASYNPVLDSQGKVTKVIKFAIDVTERKTAASDAAGKIAAISDNQAIIEFETDGTILTANANFLATMGYTLEEIKGKHHRIFLDRRQHEEAEYAKFWSDLAQGDPKKGVFRRLNKKLDLVWISAVYAPITGPNGDIAKVVKFATDITDSHAQAVDYQGKIDAISRSQAIIEFTPEGEILDANENFLSVTGYTLEEIKGRHHRIFVDPDEAGGSGYTAFWEALGKGEYQTGEYQRFGKGNREFWIQATYNPIFDRGRIVKVVKFATDITERHRATEGLARGLRALAASEAQVRMGQEVDGEFAGLRDSFNMAMDQREEMIEALVATSKKTLEECEELSKISRDLSNRAESQAATLEETAAAMEEISNTVASTAGNAKSADSAARTASEEANQGRSVLEDTIGAMQRIEEGSSKISSIVETINGIAFQTNLLALNAGVEAARAGEAGRGFAVVASEVRALAQRAADASKEIEVLIAQNSRQVSEGSQFVQSTGDVLDRIVKGVESVVESVTGISAAADEQVNGIREISSATNNMDRITQHNAELADKSASSAAALTQRARDLMQLADSMSQDESQIAKSA